MDGADGLAPAKRLLLTGAAGRVARLIRPGLGGLAAHVRLCDLRDMGPLLPWEEAVTGDLCTVARRAVAGCDAIVHLAGIASESDLDPLIDANIRATHALYEAARVEGVRRILMASTNHVTGFYPATERVGPADPPRPDSLYAVSKLWCEGLARFHYDAYGIETAIVRIGSVAPRPETPRHRHSWFAPGDLVSLIRTVIEPPALGCPVFYGATPLGDDCYWTAEGRPEGWVPTATVDARDLPGGVAGPWQGGGLADRFSR